MDGHFAPGIKRHVGQKPFVPPYQSAANEWIRLLHILSKKNDQIHAASAAEQRFKLAAICSCYHDQIHAAFSDDLL